MVLRTTHCKECLSSLSTKIVPDNSTHALITRKNKVGLIIPLESVSKIYLETEMQIRRILNITKI